MSHIYKCPGQCNREEWPEKKCPGRTTRAPTDTLPTWTFLGSRETQTQPQTVKDSRTRRQTAYPLSHWNLDVQIPILITICDFVRGRTNVYLLNFSTKLKGIVLRKACTLSFQSLHQYSGRWDSSKYWITSPPSPPSTWSGYSKSQCCFLCHLASCKWLYWYWRECAETQMMSIMYGTSPICTQSPKQTVLH